MSVLWLYCQLCGEISPKKYDEVSPLLYRSSALFYIVVEALSPILYRSRALFYIVVEPYFITLFHNQKTNTITRKLKPKWIRNHLFKQKLNITGNERKGRNALIQCKIQKKTNHRLAKFTSVNKTNYYIFIYLHYMIFLFTPYIFKMSKTSTLTLST